MKHQDIVAKEIMYHPRYKKHDHYNDVAVIVLDDNFELDRHINTICLPKELDTAKYISWDKCFATGWGKDSFGNSGRYQEIMKQILLGFKIFCHSSGGLA